MSTEEMVDWSSLPADLVNRVSDCFLATNDLDYYMSFRAVCHPWRSATTDPKTSHDRRFYPTQWIILDEFYQNGHGRLFLNARTGRFLRKAVPLQTLPKSPINLLLQTLGLVTSRPRTKQEQEQNSRWPLKEKKFPKIMKNPNPSYSVIPKIDEPYNPKVKAAGLPDEEAGRGHCRCARRRLCSCSLPPPVAPAHVDGSQRVASDAEITRVCGRRCRCAALGLVVVLAAVACVLSGPVRAHASDPDGLKGTGRTPLDGAARGRSRTRAPANGARWRRPRALSLSRASLAPSQYRGERKERREWGLGFGGPVGGGDFVPATTCGGRWIKIQRSKASDWVDGPRAHVGMAQGYRANEVWITKGPLRKPRDALQGTNDNMPINKKSETLPKSPINLLLQTLGLVTSRPRTKQEQEQNSRWQLKEKVCIQFLSPVVVHALGYRSCTSNSYILLTTTTGGFLILVDYDTSPPCAVSILNPFTGYSIRFSAPLPVSHETEITAAVVGLLPTLVLASVDSDDVYWADPLSETFHVEKYGNSPASRLPMIGAKYAPDVRASAAASLPFSYANKLFEEEMRMGSRCFVVAWDDGEVLLVFKQAGKRVVAHRVDSAGHVVEKVKSIGSRALFLGTRCLVVDADRFPTIGPNKIYYLREENPVDEYGCVYDVEDDIYAYAIEGDTENKIVSQLK
ncbi:hypothetical protein EJB05_36333, partial [Eragrostis curvula]